MRDSLWRRLTGGEAGIETVEWCIMAALIVAEFVTVLSAIGAWLQKKTSWWARFSPDPGASAPKRECGRVDLAGSQPSYLPWACVLGASLVAAYWDLRSRRIPNWLTGPVLAGGLIYRFYCSGEAGLVDALWGCLVLAAPYVVLFVFAGGGAGDAKLMGSLGAWLGMQQGLVVLVAVACCGILLGFVFAAGRKRIGEVLFSLRSIAWGLVVFGVRRGGLTRARDLFPTAEQMQPMPYGLAVLGGVCVACAGVWICHG